MNIMLTVARPFSFDQTLTFLRRFTPCAQDLIITDDALTGALAVGNRAVPFTLRAKGEGVELEVKSATDAPLVARRVSDFIGARDDLAAFYEAAEGDGPFEQLIGSLHGLRHVRFLTLEEITVYSVLMQRTPIKLAALYKRRFLDAFGIVAENGLRAWPTFERLVDLTAAEIEEALGHRLKAPLVANAIAGVAKLGEDFLLTAKYETARDKLVEIKGIGPFSASAILLRGLGRMDELPIMPKLAEEARRIYGPDYDEQATLARYGKHIGYWSFYLKTGVARMAPATIAARKRRAK